MIRILHLSDPHSQSEVINRINNLSLCFPDCDVVAFTGDYVSSFYKQVPPSWNEWPQKLKLSVPGNHDHKQTFDLLSNWNHKTPWDAYLDPLLFIGLNWQEDFGSDAYRIKCVKEHLQEIDSTAWEKARGIAVLCHAAPSVALINLLYSFAGSKSILYLHGHDHRTGFAGTHWQHPMSSSDMAIYCSHVCSCMSHRRGLSHYIEYQDGEFSCKVIQGPKCAPNAKHKQFGRGFIEKVEGSGPNAKLTIEFPLVGTKKVIAQKVELIK